MLDSLIALAATLGVVPSLVVVCLIVRFVIGGAAKASGYGPW